MITNKYIKDGKVAVLISSGHGSGWFTWNNNIELLFEPVLAEMIDKKESMDKIKSYFVLKYGDDDWMIRGLKSLDIEWVDPGQKFRIEEYDGNETLILFEHDFWITA